MCGTLCRLCMLRARAGCGRPSLGLYDFLHSPTWHSCCLQRGWSRFWCGAVCGLWTNLRVRPDASLLHGGVSLRLNRPARPQELAPLVTAIEGVVDRLDQSFAQQRQFLGDAAHELKTAVAVIKSSLQLLNMRPRSVVEYQEGVLRCEVDCSRMEELVGRMLALARIEAATAEKTGELIPQDTVLLDGLLGAMEQLRPVAAVTASQYERA